MKGMIIAVVFLIGRSVSADGLNGVICVGEQCKQMQQNLDYSLFIPTRVAAPLPPSPPVNPVPDGAKHGASGSRGATHKDKIRSTRAHPVASLPEERGNLPPYLESGALSAAPGADSSFFMTFSSKKGSLKSARAGSVFNAVIEQSILASPTTPNPIIATITNGPLAGATLLGEAAFGKELKCILLNFNLLKSKDGESTFQLKGVGTAPSGEACIEGQYESQNGRFFLAEMLATGTAVVVDSQVQRSQNVLGNYVEEPSLSNAAKKGLAASLTKTAEHAAEGMKSAPEFTRLAGFQPIRVIFQSDAIEN